MKQPRYNFKDELRAKRLYDLYLIMKRSGKYASLYDITKELEITPMPIHYISFYTARRIYYRHFEKKQDINYASISKNILYNSFILTCKKLQQQGMTEPNKIISAALLSEAPCIGLSESYIRRILKEQGAK